MSQMTDYLENKLIDFLFRGQALGITGATAAAGTGPSTLYVGLYTTNPTGDNGTGGTEVSTTGTNYARASIASSLANWAGTGTNSGGSVSSGTDGKTSNAGAVTFNTPGGTSWGTITGFGIFDAATSGNLLLYGSLTTSKAVNTGDGAPQFNANQLTVTFA